MDLNKKERLIIANQLRILERLYPSEEVYYAQQRKAIEAGYKLHYDGIFENILDEMSEDECKEILEILQMYRSITFSYKRLGDATTIDENTIKFEGFDGNNETKQLLYTQYFIIDLGRFDELRYGAEMPDFNSHMPMLDIYRRMLTVWNDLHSKHNLTAEQINALLEAQRWT